MEEILKDYFTYVFTHASHDVEYFNNWWMLFIVPAITWFIVLVLKYFIITSPILFIIKLVWHTINFIFGIREFTKSDVEFAFDKGIHEGKLREHYKDKPNTFSESGLEYYMQNYKKED